jgi:ketosteroid isomerase-like protein
MFPLRFLAAATVVALFACTGSPNGEGSAAAPVEAVRLDDERRIMIADSVRRTLEGFAQVVQSMNAEEIASFYADDPDMHWIEDGEVVYRSPRDVAAAIRELGTTMTIGRLMYDGTEVNAVAPGVAIVMTGFAQQFTTLSGETGGFAGVITAVMVHRGGRWLFLSGHTSSAGNRASGE